MKLVRFKQLADYGITWSRVHVNRMESAGRFPKRCRIGPGTIGWLESEIELFIQAAANSR